MLETQSPRQCGGCRACCKLLRIDDLNKPAQQWCVHAAEHGCGIYGAHPEVCRAFFCDWIEDKSLSDAWRPDRSGFILSRSPSGKGLFINVDTDTPDAWKAEPFYSAFKQWARELKTGEYIVASVEPHAFVIYPEEDVKVCTLGPGTQIQVDYRRAANARQPHVMVRVATGDIHQFFGQIYCD